MIFERCLKIYKKKKKKKNKENVKRIIRKKKIIDKSHEMYVRDFVFDMKYF